MPCIRICGLILAVCVIASDAGAALPIPEGPRWTPVVDDVYLQEVGRQVRTDTPLACVAVLDGAVFAGSDKGVLRLEGDKLERLGGPKGVERMRVVGNALWVVAAKGIWRYADGAWTEIAQGDYVDVCEHRGATIATSNADVFIVASDRLEKINSGPAAESILGVASYSETIYIRHANRIGFLMEGRFEYDDVQDWGHLPLDATTRDMVARGSELLVPTDKGLGVLRGMTWDLVSGEDGLCYEDTTCAAEGFARDYWVGTKRGAMRAVHGEFHYFGFDRWLPHEKVNGIACVLDAVYVATDGGLGIIEYVPYTMQKKSAWYKQWLEQWGMKRLGFVNSLNYDPESGKYTPFLSDNDVSWACHYLNALCFEYAVTGDPAVRDEAVDVFRTVRWSEQISGIEGFPARAIYAVGEDAIKASTGSAGLPAEWNPTPDGLWEWKGDTSSDEVDAHVYTVSLFYELVAQGAEKEAAKEHLDRLVGHIVDRGWVLRDLDGKPTRWARWDPEYLQRPYGFDARGLNGMEAINYVTTAFALTGNAKFNEGKKQLLEWGYHNEALRQKLVFPTITHFDDRLAFLAYYPLLRYETDPQLRSIFIRSLERSWEVKRVENQPWFSYIYGASTGNDCENERAVQHLREYPLDCTDYAFTNSHRSDLATPAGYRNYAADWKPMGPREQGIRRWDRDPLQLDGGGSHGVLDPSGWLDAYWMGRYYGFIKAPTTTDPELLEVKKSAERRGAAPYQGPPRPDMGF